MAGADVAPDCLARPVPRLALQLLVENAVKHGIGRRQAGGCIELKVERLDVDSSGCCKLVIPGRVDCANRPARAASPGSWQYRHRFSQFAPTAGPAVRQRGQSAARPGWRLGARAVNPAVAGWKHSCRSCSADINSGVTLNAGSDCRRFKIGAA